MALEFWLKMRLTSHLFLALVCTACWVNGCPTEQLRALDDNSTLESESRQATSNPVLLWPNGIVPYQISSAYGAQHRSIILDGIAEFGKYTCIRFVPRTTQKDYILFEEHSSGSCWTGKWGDSRVGFLGGLHYVSLIVKLGCLRKFNVMHELMHTLGFWHEQQRDDRDKYVKVFINNIQPAVRDVAFGIKQQSRDQVTNLNTPYDYNSIMHYHQSSFAIDSSKPVMAATDGCSLFGNEKQFSKVDVLRMNRLYKCPADFSKPTPPRVTYDFDPYHTCASCKDNNGYCGSWAATGECTKNPDYMYFNCQKSCGICS